MPNRWLKESYLASSRINAATPEARDCWVRLVVVADDHGLYHADPQLVASRCFPLKPSASKCAQLLDELEAVHLISRYRVNGRPYLRIEQWYERARAGPKYPPPPASANNGEQLPADASNGEQMKAPTGTPYYHDHDHDHGVARERAPAKRPRAVVVLTEPTPEHRALADELGLDCNGQFAAYHDHFAATGKRHVDENAGFRNWLRRSHEFGTKGKNGRPAAATPSQRRTAAIDILTGRTGDDRTIEGAAERLDSTPIPALPGSLRQ